MEVCPFIHRHNPLSLFTLHFIPTQNTYNFKVGMTCTGCSGAVDRILKKTDGVKSYDISLETQTVTVVAAGLTQEQVFETIKKSGKPVELL
ncbi:hypothetical protein BC830DRAFT_1060763 [Chytriomyces sp. MP71]|nr:hypothetical protein BC830DRAFT_1060763 [Chytriomyces sp. MP71]